MITKGGSKQSGPTFWGWFLSLLCYPFRNLKFLSISISEAYDLDDLYQFDMLILCSTLLCHQMSPKIWSRSLIFAAGLHEHIGSKPLMIFMQFGMETLFATLLNYQKIWSVSLSFAAGLHEWSQKAWWISCNLAWKLYLLPSWITKRFDQLHWFLLLVCMNSLWNGDDFHAIWHENLIYLIY